jgi:hypothetical protein
MEVDTEHKYNTIIERSKPEFSQVNVRSLETSGQVRNFDSEQLKDASKFLTSVAEKIHKRNMVLSPLLDYATETNSINLNTYWNAFKCGTYFSQSDNSKLKQQLYCGSRLCNRCCNVRSVKLSKAMASLIDTGKQYVHLTLTNSNQGLKTINDVEVRLNNDNKIFGKIKDSSRKKGTIIDALIGLEIIPPVYKRNTKTKVEYYADFHPHYHCFTTLECALIIKQMWLKFNPDAMEINQKIRVLDTSTNEALMNELSEIIKYSIKSHITIKDANENIVTKVNLKGIDEIVTLMRGKRRLKTWGAFYNVGSIETMNIDEMDMKAQRFKNVPVLDTLPEVEMNDYKGNFIKMVPAMVREVGYQYCHKRFNFFYDLYGVNELQVSHYVPKERKMEFFVDKKRYFKKSSSELNQSCSGWTPIDF